MGQISKKLRRGADAHFHYCPACEEMHILPDSWTFDGNLVAPTFSPSFKHQGGRFKKGTDEGEMFVCHYILTAGVLHYCADSTHSVRGAVPLPDLPPEYCDPLASAHPGK